MYKAIVIDDEKWVIKSLLATIEGQNFFEIVGQANDGISGLKMLQNLQPDLAFVDVKMPGLCGLEILQECQKQNLKTLFIVISGHAEFAYAQKAMFYNAISYALKPFSRNELLESMEKAYTDIKNRVSEDSEALKPEVAELIANIPQVKNKMVKKMLAFTHAHYFEDISIQMLADLCNINPNYVSQLFRQEMGETFSRYLAKLRMAQAAYLLTVSDESMTAISSKIGYSDYFYFAKVFKKELKVTPTEYRMQKNIEFSQKDDEEIGGTIEKY